MHFPTPLSIFFPYLLLATQITAHPDPTPDPTLSLCQSYLGPSYTDFCCPYVESGSDTPCGPYAVPVSNVSECTIEAYPRGWGCCVKQDVNPIVRKIDCVPSSWFNESGVVYSDESIWVTFRRSVEDMMLDMGLAGKLAKSMREG
ncbi:hypothetical protein FB567DRAFT_531224 [Paraphoma chrysanthemicola]|uniref:Uncharacterized protein n=1 Tax=Paraphoma chrysanthemicola TaxID=798071 RepID=A0A8K0R3S6_9PLEO|nr:hypothetical protein FB567DRAFT_531224 [Paraphoma chrysanthemicola]